jgi:hypothetical protein
MKKHFQYLWYILRHKWFVFLAGIKIGAPIWRLIVHDLSKFRPSEWFAYVNFFYGKKIESLAKDRQEAFDRAWLHHQRRNPHHWQYWVLTEDNPGGEHHPNKNDGDINSISVRVRDKYGADQKVVCEVPIPAGIDGYTAIDIGFFNAQTICSALNGGVKVIRMPPKYVKEMVADWAGAGRAITGKWEVADWYEKNCDRMLLDNVIRFEIRQLMDKFGHQD